MKLKKSMILLTLFAVTADVAANEYNVKVDQGLVEAGNACVDGSKYCDVSSTISRLGIEWLPSGYPVGFSLSAVNFGQTANEFNVNDLYGVELTGAYYYQLLDEVRVFGALRLPYYHSKTRHHVDFEGDYDSEGFGYGLGVGLEYKLNERFDIGFGLDHYPSIVGDSKLTALYASVRYNLSHESEVVIVEPRPTAVAMEPVQRFGEVYFDHDVANSGRVDFSVHQLALRLYDKNESTPPEGEKFEIHVVGHADQVGSSQYNQRLSLRRAQWVFDYLVEHGISSKDIRVHYSGEEFPLYADGLQALYPLNRRVDVFLVQGSTYYE